MQIRQQINSAPDGCRRGVTAVEMAFALPVLLTMVLGLIEISHAFMVQHLIQDAARQGCRTGICPRSTNAQVQATVNGLLQGEGIKNASTSILVNNVEGDVSRARSRDEISVRVTIAASDVTIVPLSGYLAGALTGSFTLRMQ